MSRRLHAGLIPAHAGKTSFILGVLISDWAHPRSRGENHRCVHLRTVASGSSPLTRGKPRANASMSARVGLIPAHAGKTGRRRGRSQQLSAHPRSRGENCFHDRGRSNANGSSPLTRGKQGGYRVNGRGLRLIPAHAGKTCATSTGNSHAPAHPRSRGENSTPAFSRACIAGSSPLTRGKPGHASHDHGFSGLIPAHAGKTLVSEATPEDSGAHPRSRGENTSRAILNPALAGSSPLTRGKQQGDYRPMLELRLIPAHAGKTSPGRRSRPCCRAHPRSRGENAS